MDHGKKAGRLEDRLQREAARRGKPMEDVRHEMLALGLGAAMDAVVRLRVN